jgi:putative ABC transport system permease protein
MALTGLTWLPQEIWVVGLTLGVGLLAALLPAFQAYRTDIAALLASRA